MWIDSFRARVETHPNRVAIVAQGRTTSYGDLWRGAAAVARGIPARGARHLITEADPQTALETVIGAWMAGKVPAIVAPDLPSEAVSQVAQRLAQPAPTRDDPALREALITTTSGSSGTPKLVVHPHRSLDTSFRYQQQLVGLPEDTQELISAGMHLSRALITNSLQGLYEGWTLHLFPGGTAGGVLQAHIRSHGIGMMAGPASFFRMFFRYGEDAVFPTFRYVRTSGEHTPWSVVEQMQVAFPEALVVLGYGMTELCTRITAISAKDPRARMGAIGTAAPYLETRILPVPGIPAPAGELLLRGGTLCLGYLQPDGGYAGLDADGFFHTGDLMRIEPDGYLMHMGRIGRLVKVGGILANPAEVEEVLRSLPGVRDALCWAEPHDLLGNTLAAQVVSEPGTDLDVQTLRRACRERLERHKVPHTLTLVEQLAVTPGGKRSLRPLQA